MLVAAGEGVALVPASATALRVDGVVYKPLTNVGGGHPDSDPARPVELHAIWPRGNLAPMLRKVLHLIRRSAERLDDLIFVRRTRPLPGGRPSGARRQQPRNNFTAVTTEFGLPSTLGQRTRGHGPLSIIHTL